MNRRRVRRSAKQLSDLWERKMVEFFRDSEVRRATAKRITEVIFVSFQVILFETDVRVREHG